MRKVFLEDMVKLKTGHINWVESARKNLKVKFQYDDKEGEVTLISYNRDGNKRSLTVLYNNKEYVIDRADFSEGKIYKMAYEINFSDYLYDIGYKFSNNTILEQIRVSNGKTDRKGYLVECSICKSKNKLSETQVKEKQHCCKLCSNRKVVHGLNDLATTHPHLTKYFKNIDDASKYSYGSMKKLELICPHCKSINSNLAINTLVKSGFVCKNCSDGISFPEKFFYSLMKQINIEFKSQFKIIDNTRYYYDFYIPSLNMIIETHGRQHYESGGFESLHGKTLQEEQENDKLKRELALANGIEHYIELDCRKSELEWIKNSILNSKLVELFDLSSIDWKKCCEFAYGNEIKRTCELWNTNEFKSTTALGFFLGVDRHTIRIRLLKGVSLNWCQYNGYEQQKLTHLETFSKWNEKQKKRIICLNNEKTFSSIMECQRKSIETFGVYMDNSKIVASLKGRATSIYTYFFAYLDEENQIITPPKIKTNSFLVSENLNLIFKFLKDLSKYLLEKYNIDIDVKTLKKHIDKEIPIEGMLFKKVTNHYIVDQFISRIEKNKELD